MTEVYTGASVSLDGYIAGPGESGLEHLFKWLGNGDVVVPTTDPELTMRMTEVNAAHWRGVVDMTATRRGAEPEPRSGRVSCGRRGR
jgi:hypothetical protein